MYNHEIKESDRIDSGRSSKHEENKSKNISSRVQEVPLYQINSVVSEVDEAENKKWSQLVTPRNITEHVIDI